MLLPGLAALFQVRITPDCGLRLFENLSNVILLETPSGLREPAFWCEWCERLCCPAPALLCSVPAFVWLLSGSVSGGQVENLVSNSSVLGMFSQNLDARYRIRSLQASHSAAKWPKILLQLANSESSTGIPVAAGHTTANSDHSARQRRRVRKQARMERQIVRLTAVLSRLIDVSARVSVIRANYRVKRRIWQRGNGAAGTVAGVLKCQAGCVV